MAYNEYLAQRVKDVFNSQNIAFVEKKMFGGWCVMLDEKMCIGVVFHKQLQVDVLMCRVHPQQMDELLSMPECITMEFTGKPMTGFVFVTEDGFRSKKQLEYWCQICIDFNPLAKKSKKKSTS